MEKNEFDVLLDKAAGLIYVGEWEASQDLLLDVLCAERENARALEMMAYIGFQKGNGEMVRTYGQLLEKTPEGGPRGRVYVAFEKSWVAEDKTTRELFAICDEDPEWLLIYWLLAAANVKRQNLVRAYAWAAVGLEFGEYETHGLYGREADMLRSFCQAYRSVLADGGLIDAANAMVNKLKLEAGRDLRIRTAKVGLEM